MADQGEVISQNGAEHDESRTAHSENTHEGQVKHDGEDSKKGQHDASSSQEQEKASASSEKRQDNAGKQDQKGSKKRQDNASRKKEQKSTEKHQDDGSVKQEQSASSEQHQGDASAKEQKSSEEHQGNASAKKEQKGSEEQQHDASAKEQKGSEQHQDDASAKKEQKSSEEQQHDASAKEQKSSEEHQDNASAKEQKSPEKHQDDSSAKKEQTASSEKHQDETPHDEKQAADRSDSEQAHDTSPHSEATANGKDSQPKAVGETSAALKKSKDSLEKKMKQSFKFLGIEFAPVVMPIERRLQTLSVLMTLIISISCPFLMIAAMVMLLFSPLFPLPILYATWMYYDRRTPHRGGRRYEVMRRLPVWRYFRDYFPITLTKTADLNPGRNYLIGYHPHGILAFGAVLNFASEATGFSKAFPNIKSYVLTLNAQFRWPIIRAYLMSFGVCAVSRESIKYILSTGPGNAAIIVVGGAEEALEARPGSFTVVLRARKGFVRQAIQHGADLVPCYSFGENDIYKQFDNTPGSRVRVFQEAFKRLMSFSPPIIYGRGIFNYSFGLMPYRRPIDTVVGKPIRVDRDENPSDDLVERYHQQYVDSLYQLFEDHKDRHGIAPDVHLNIV